MMWMLSASRRRRWEITILSVDKADDLRWDPCNRLDGLGMQGSVGRCMQLMQRVGIPRTRHRLHSFTIRLQYRAVSARRSGFSRDPTSDVSTNITQRGRAANTAFIGSALPTGD